MPQISVTDARALFTKKLVSVYLEQPRVTTFLRSFFKVEESLTKEVSIEVRRGFEKIAVDVIRGTEGNRNVFSKSTEKIFVPPLYWEYLVANDHKLYDVAIGMQSEVAFAELAKQLGVDLFDMQQKIERAIEKQCADVLLTGIITLANGDNIDFKRKSASLFDGSSTPWTDNANDPLIQIADACTWIRQNGKSQGAIFNVIMGSQAKAAFSNNTKVTAKGDLLRINNLDISMPQRNSVGGTTHGMAAAGDYSVRIWTYPEFYTAPNGTSTPYVDPKKIIVLPENPNFVLAFAAVPQLIGKNGEIPQKGAYLISEHIDERASNHEIHIKSAPVAIPVAVDQIYTRKVIAG
jgi:hypothetical protein